MSDHVLLCSEDSALIEMLREEAASNGVRFTVADTGHALELVRSANPSLVLMDLDQRVDGRLLLARVKQDARTRTIPVAMITAQVRPELSRFAREFQALHLDTRPLRPGYLAATLLSARGGRRVVGRR